MSFLKPVHPASGPETTETEPPPPLGIEGSLAYLVKEIMESRQRRGQIQYLVDWEGCRTEERSWVASKDILGPSLIQDFNKKHPTRPAPRPRGRPIKKEHWEVLVEGGFCDISVMQIMEINY